MLISEYCKSLSPKRYFYRKSKNLALSNFVINWVDIDA
jgi:hypothetical protein